MKIYHWLFPTKKNKFHPLALRPVGLAIFLFIFIAIPPLYNAVSAKQMQVLGYATSVSVSDVYNLTNQERGANGLAPLALDGQLNSAAFAKANDMFADNYWAHVAPDGTTPWYFITSAGYTYTSAGENLAKDFNTSSGVVAGWMGSATHRANILNTSYQDIGIAVVNGVLLGSETTLVVAMYGARPAPAPTPAPAAAIPSTPATPSTPVETPPIAETPTPTVTETPATQPEPEITSPTTTQTQPVEQEQGEVEGVSTFLPVKVYNGMNWGQKTSLVLLSILALLFIMKHTIVWRAQKRGYRHIWLRAHPLSQLAMLSAIAIVTILSSIGTIL
ncbi:MAG: CAP domain-containing protein [Candidatus Microsaccharimonas sp.]